MDQAVAFLPPLVGMSHLLTLLAFYVVLYAGVTRGALAVSRVLERLARTFS